jgi:hypothetical protein
MALSMMINCINTPKLEALNECITYYNKFIDRDPLITENSILEFILICLLNNADVIALIIYVGEVVLLLFKVHISPDYVDERIDYETNMIYTPKLKFVQLSLNIEKEKQDLQKKIDNFNMLIFKDIYHQLKIDKKNCIKTEKW